MFDAERAKMAASPLIETYQQMEDELLANIASHLRLSDGEVDINQWYTDKLMDMGEVNRKNIKIIADKAGATIEQLERFLESTGYGALEMDETLYEMAFAKGKLISMPVNVSQSPYLKNILRTAVAMAKEELNLVNTTAKQTARKAYTDTVNKAYLNVVTGTRDYNSAIRQAVKELGEFGIKGVNYITATGSRRTEQLDVAVRRSVLTASSQLAGEMQLQRAEEWGSDLVEVDSHMGSRPSHAEWQGRIYSRSGKSKKYRSFYEVTKYGQIDGLKGINCRHDFYPFFEGISEHTFKPYDIQKNNKQYEASQQQRKIEREIRKEKRKIVAAESAGDTEAMKAYHKNLRGKQAEMRRHISATGLPRQSEREQLVNYKTGVVNRSNTKNLLEYPKADQAKKAMDQRESAVLLNKKPPLPEGFKRSGPETWRSEKFGSTWQSGNLNEAIKNSGGHNYSGELSDTKLKIEFTTDNPRVKIIYSPSGDYYRYELNGYSDKNPFRYGDEQGNKPEVIRQMLRQSRIEEGVPYSQSKERSEYERRTHYKNN